MNYYNYNKKSRGGFTLIELLVVIAVISALSGIVLQSLQEAKYKSHNVVRLSDIDQIDKAIHLYMTATNQPLPIATSFQCVGLQSGTCWASYTPATALNSAITPYISKIPKDPVRVTGADYYLYHSNLSNYAGEGAYLIWYANDIGSKPCGRGNTTTVSGDKLCYLFVGKN